MKHLESIIEWPTMNSLKQNTYHLVKKTKKPTAIVRKYFLDYSKGVNFVLIEHLSTPG